MEALTCTTPGIREEVRMLKPSLLQPNNLTALKEMKATTARKTTELKESQPRLKDN